MFSIINIWIFSNFEAMKKVLHKIIATNMALLLLVITTSWKVEKHYCMGYLIDVAFFVSADDCEVNLLPEGDNDTVEKACCADEVIAVEGQSDVRPSGNDLNLDQQLFLTVYSYTYLNLFEPLEVQNFPHKYYLSPKIVKDIQLLGDVFLI